MKKYFVRLMSRLLYSMTHQVMWYFWVFIVNPFSILWNISFSQDNRVSFGLLVSCLTTSQSAQIRLVNLLWYFYFLKIISPSEIILPISLDELNSIHWLLKISWWVSWNNVHFIVVKDFWYAKNIRGFWENLFECFFKYYCKC